MSGNEAENYRDDPTRKLAWLAGGKGPGWDLRCYGWSMLSSLTDRTARPDLELLSCEHLANPAAVADVQVLTTECTQNTAMSFITQGRHGSKL